MFLMTMLCHYAVENHSQYNLMIGSYVENHSQLWLSELSTENAQIVYC